MFRRGYGLLLSLFWGGCSGAAAAPAKPPGAPPSPASVTVQQPGGDARDPQAAALQRLLFEPWGQRGDKDQQLNVGLPDPGNWKRVRYRGVDNFLGFRYGKEHYGMVVVFVQDTEEQQPSSEACLRRFENWGRPLTRPFDVEFRGFHPSYQRFRERTVIALSVDGELSFAFSRPKFSAAWAAYALYPHACLILAVAVPWRDNPALAQKVRDRFVAEGFPLLEPLTDVRPRRK